VIAVYHDPLVLLLWKTSLNQIPMFTHPCFRLMRR